MFKIRKILDCYESNMEYKNKKPHCLEISEITDIESLFILLHELGHIAMGVTHGWIQYIHIRPQNRILFTHVPKAIDIFTGKFVSNMTILQEEIDAWMYAFKCVKTHHHISLFKIMICGLKTYFYVNCTIEGCDYFRKNMKKIGILDQIIEYGIEQLINGY